MSPHDPGEGGWESGGFLAELFWFATDSNRPQSLG